MPLFDAGKVRAQVRQARAALRWSLATYRQTVLAAFQEVEDNLAAAAILAQEAAVQAKPWRWRGSPQPSRSINTRRRTVSYLDVVTAQSAPIETPS